MHHVTVTNSAEQFRCPDNCSILVGMANMGGRAIPVGCRNGGCGVCKVRITRGEVARKVMSRAHISAEEEAEGLVLACRIYPQSDIELAVVGKMRRAFGELVDDLKPDERR